VPDVKSKVGKESYDGDGRVRNDIEGRKSSPWSTYPAERPTYAKHRRNGERERVWNDIEVLLIEVEERPFLGRGADSSAVWSAE
jgi:hypothetical protein